MSGRIENLKHCRAFTLQLRHVKSENVFRDMETCRHIREVSKGPSAFLNGDELEGGKLDILVRTSDVKRLSDFMMWQVCPDGLRLDLAQDFSGVRRHTITLCEDLLA